MLNFKRTYLILLAFMGVVAAFAPQTVHGQRHFNPGFLITQSGDTLHGEIRDQPYRNHYLSIEFRSTSSPQVRTYHPQDVSGYGLDNGFIFMSQSFLSADSTETHQRFMRLFFDGRVRLFLLADQKDERYFVERNNELFELTNSHSISRYETDSRRLLMRREYVGMLLWLFAEGVERDFSLSDKIQSTALNPLSLAQTAQAYHNLVCDEGEECVIILPKEPFRIRISPFVGYGFSSFTHNYLDSEGSRIGSIPSFNPRLGARLDFHLPSLSNFGRVFIAVSYERFNGEFFKEYRASDVLNLEVHAFAAFSAIHSNIGFVVPLKKFLYPSQVYFGYRQSYIFNGRVYNFPNHVERMNSAIDLDKYLQGSVFGSISPGAVAGYQYLYAFSPKMALSIGLEFSLLGTSFNDETRFVTASGLQLGFVFN